MYFFNLLHLCRKKKSTLKEAQVVRISSHFEELESSDSKAAGKIFQGESSAKKRDKNGNEKIELLQ